MGRLLSTIVAVALLLGLGVLAVMALPGAAAPMTAGAVAAAPLAAEPDAPAALMAGTPKWNSIALPLDVTASGVTDSQKIANYISTGNANTIGTSVLRVMKWSRLEQRWIDYIPQDPDLGDPVFTVDVGDALLVLLDSTQTSTVLSWVGDVPLQNTITNQLSQNAWNFITVPLDQYATYGSLSAPSGTAATLAGDITGITRVMKWEASEQRWVDYIPQDPDLGDADYAVNFGYPYLIRTDNTAPTQWP